VTSGVNNFNYFPVNQMTSLNKHRLRWGSILYGLLPQHPQFGSNCYPWVSPHMCARVRFGRSRSSKVIDFGTNRKRMLLPISPS